MLSAYCKMCKTHSIVGGRVGLGNEAANTQTDRNHKVFIRSAAAGNTTHFSQCTVYGSSLGMIDYVDQEL